MTPLSQTIAETRPRRIESKWTIVNEEWVQVHCEILRGSGGLYDRPASRAPATTKHRSEVDEPGNAASARR